MCGDKDSTKGLVFALKRVAPGESERSVRELTGV